MNAKHLWPVAVLLAGVVAGCGSAEEAAPKTEAEKQEALREGAFGDMVGTMDRASEAAQLPASRKADLDAALDEQE